MKRSRLKLAVCLLVASTTFAQGEAPDVWISLGAESLPAVQEAFTASGVGALALPTDQVGEVVVLHLPEPQLVLVSEVMHAKFGRCAGFIVHPSRPQALADLNDPTPRQAMERQAVLYSLDNASTVNALMAEMQAANVESTIVGLSSFRTRLYTTDEGRLAATWLRDRWQGYAQGRNDVGVELYAHSAWVQPSVIMTITGSTTPSEVVVIGGHLDSINGSGGSGASAPGADDDASGVASFTEVIRAAMALGYRPERTVKFMAYAGEEGGLRGSKEIATAYKNAGVNVIGALQLDMTNYKGSSVDVGLVTDHTNLLQNQFITTLIDIYGGGITWSNTACGYACSDHASWTNAGYPSSIPFESLFGQYNPTIHTSNDTLASSGGNATHALKFSKIAAAYLGELAKGKLAASPTGSTAAYDPALKVPRCATTGAWCESGALLAGRAGLGPELNAPSTINGACEDGASGAFHSAESNDWLKVSTDDGSVLSAGKLARVEARVWAFSGFTGDKLDLYSAADATSPVWTFIATLTPPGAGSQVLSATYTLPAGATQAVRARFRYQGTAAACGSGSYVDHDDLVFAVAAAAPDAVPPAASVAAPAANASVTGTVNVVASASDNVGVTMVSLLVDGVVRDTDGAAPFSFAWDSGAVAAGLHTLAVRATDAAGNSVTSAPVTVNVTASSGVFYDPGLMAPRCSTVGSACDSRTLLTGRGPLGPEQNLNNTIRGTCADGTEGTFHSDESIDRIRVSTLDGTLFAAGKRVQVEVTVWGRFLYTADRLDLYATGNANNPSWTYLGTLAAPGRGQRVLSATYTLPSGTTQAVRARFRYQGNPAPCGAGAYDDHDDLIFAVQ